MRAGGDDGFNAWHERLALATQRYTKVMMVGDSMVRGLPRSLLGNGRQERALFAAVKAICKPCQLCHV